MRRTLKKNKDKDGWNEDRVYNLGKMGWMNLDFWLWDGWGAREGVSKLVLSLVSKSRFAARTI
jgi:hypothetical protein